MLENTYAWTYHRRMVRFSMPFAFNFDVCRNPAMIYSSGSDDDGAGGLDAIVELSTAPERTDTCGIHHKLGERCFHVRCLS